MDREASFYSHMLFFLGSLCSVLMILGHTFVFNPVRAAFVVAWRVPQMVAWEYQQRLLDHDGADGTDDSDGLDNGNDADTATTTSSTSSTSTVRGVTSTRTRGRSAGLSPNDIHFEELERQNVLESQYRQRQILLQRQRQRRLNQDQNSELVNGTQPVSSGDRDMTTAYGVTNTSSRTGSNNNSNNGGMDEDSDIENLVEWIIGNRSSELSNDPVQLLWPDGARRHDQMRAIAREQARESVYGIASGIVSAGTGAGGAGGAGAGVAAAGPRSASGRGRQRNAEHGVGNTQNALVTTTADAVPRAVTTWATLTPLHTPPAAPGPQAASTTSSLASPQTPAPYSPFYHGPSSTSPHMSSSHAGSSRLRNTRDNSSTNSNGTFPASSPLSISEVAPPPFPPTAYSAPTWNAFLNSFPVSKSELNSLIMNYLIVEGYQSAALKFSREADIPIASSMSLANNITDNDDADKPPPGAGLDFYDLDDAASQGINNDNDNNNNGASPTSLYYRQQPPLFSLDSVHDRMVIKSLILTGSIQQAIEKINDVDPELLDTNAALHFSLLRLQLIELIRAANTTRLKAQKASSSQPGATPLDDPIIRTDDLALIQPALDFAASHLARRAPGNPKFLEHLEQTMALLCFPPDKLVPQLQDLMDPKMRKLVAQEVNTLLLARQGIAGESNIQALIRLWGWAERELADTEAVDVPTLDPSSLVN